MKGVFVWFLVFAFGFSHLNGHLASLLAKHLLNTHSGFKPGMQRQMRPCQCHARALWGQAGWGASSPGKEERGQLAPSPWWENLAKLTAGFLGLRGLTLLPDGKPPALTKAEAHSRSQWMEPSKAGGVSCHPACVSSQTCVLSTKKPAPSTRPPGPHNALQWG